MVLGVWCLVFGVWGLVSTVSILGCDLEGDDALVEWGERDHLRLGLSV